MHLTPSQAQTRLSQRYGIATTLLIGDLMAASDELDELAPFRADVNLTTPPDALLDWIALRAAELARESAPKSVTVQGVSVTPAEMGVSATRRRALIGPYLKRSGTRA